MSVVMEAESIVADGDGYISAEGSPSEECYLVPLDEEDLQKKTRRGIRGRKKDIVRSGRDDQDAYYMDAGEESSLAEDSKGEVSSTAPKSPAEETEHHATEESRSPSGSDAADRPAFAFKTVLSAAAKEFVPSWEQKKVDPNPEPAAKDLIPAGLPIGRILTVPRKTVAIDYQSPKQRLLAERDNKQPPTSSASLAGPRVERPVRQPLRRQGTEPMLQPRVMQRPTSMLRPVAQPGQMLRQPNATAFAGPRILQRPGPAAQERQPPRSSVKAEHGSGPHPRDGRLSGGLLGDGGQRTYSAPLDREAHGSYQSSYVRANSAGLADDIQGSSMESPRAVPGSRLSPDKSRRMPHADYILQQGPGAQPGKVTRKILQPGGGPSKAPAGQASEGVSPSSLSSLPIMLMARPDLAAHPELLAGMGIAPKQRAAEPRVESPRVEAAKVEAARVEVPPVGIPAPNTWASKQPAIWSPSDPSEQPGWTAHTPPLCSSPARLPVRAQEPPAAVFASPVSAPVTEMRSAFSPAAAFAAWEEHPIGLGGLALEGSGSSQIGTPRKGSVAGGENERSPLAVAAAAGSPGARQQLRLDSAEPPAQSVASMPETTEEAEEFELLMNLLLTGDEPGASPGTAARVAAEPPQPSPANEAGPSESAAALTGDVLAELPPQEKSNNRVGRRRRGKHGKGKDGEACAEAEMEAAADAPTSSGSEGSAAEAHSAAIDAAVNDAMAAVASTSSPQETAASRCLVDQFVCPITQEMLKDPVIAADGFTYERKAIENWLSRKSTSPMTNDVIAHALIPNHAVRSAVQMLKDRKTSGFM